MGLWNLYFILKLSLYFIDLIDFDVWLNLALALALLMPLPANPWWRRQRLLAALPAAVALFYHDTRFPPFERLTSSTDKLGGFSMDYMLELLGRFINPIVVATCIGILIVAIMASRKLRLSSFVLLAILLVVPVNEYLRHGLPWQAPMQAMTSSEGQSASIALPGATGKPDNAALDQALSAFYKTQAGRQVAFPQSATGPAFDVMILQICSMAWDDLRLVGLDKTGPLQHFDLVFRQFNTATSYSGPAAIRLLRSTCGQTPHADLYKPVPSSCFLFEQLAAVGFQREMLLAHEGRFGGMTTEIQRYGGLNIPPDDIKDIPVLGMAFDGTVNRDDYALLKRWLDKRQQSPTERVALFYNTNSLHDGNHPVGTREGATSASGYASRVKRLFSDFERFLSELEASGRKVVVVVIPEHGAGAGGDRMQIPFMRENPSPAITNAPVGVRLIGLPRPAAPVDIMQATSYIDLAGLLRDIVQQNPFAPDGPDARTLASAITGTPHVAENEGIVVARYDTEYYIRYQDSAWSKYLYR